MADKRPDSHAARAGEGRQPASPAPSPVVETPEPQPGAEVRTFSATGDAGIAFEAPDAKGEPELVEVAHDAACPHCGGKRVPHDGSNPFKPAGALHCSECGCCFEPDGVTLRAGHPPCTQPVPTE